MNNPFVSARDMMVFDRYAIETLKVPALVLMENAGRGLSDEICKTLKSKRTPTALVVCGTGNNGGDGLVAARHLLIRAVRVKVFLLGRRADLKAGPAVNAVILEKLGVAVVELKSINSFFQRAVRASDVIVDAIFGVGLNRPVSDPFAGVIELLNASKKKIISADVPSGLDATTGRIWGVCVKADRTVTFGFPKKGFLKNAGPRVTGKVVVRDIGVPALSFRA